MRFKQVLQVEEEKEAYHLEIGTTKEENLMPDPLKLIKKTLLNKADVTNFINDFLYPKEKVQEENLIKCSNKKFKINQVELIYKIKFKSIYYVIEVQEANENNKTVNRLLNCCIDIMQTAIKSKNITGRIEDPIIFPIIIKLTKEPSRNQVKICTNKINLYNQSRIEFTYNIIAIDRISQAQLKKKETLINDVFLWQKTKNRKLLQKIEKRLQEKR